MPSYDINGQLLTNNYIINQPSAHANQMSSIKEPEQDNNCCATTVCAAVFFVAVGVIVKYAC